jgi:hypothetical protein
MVGLELGPIPLAHAARGAMPVNMRRCLDLAAPRFRDSLRDLDA